MKTITLRKTQRGFCRADFTDLYGSECSIQESSLATQAAIWLGVDKPSPQYEETGAVRMHLSQEQVAQLLPMLQKFAETGLLE